MRFITIIFLAALGLFCGCSNPNGKKLETTSKTSLAHQNITSIEIYCWCFYNKKIKREGIDTLKNVSECATLIAVKPEELLQPKYLIYSTDSINKIESFNRILFNYAQVDSLNSYVPDSRFVVLVRRKNYPDDIFAYVSNFKLYNTSDYTCHYNYNVMDSIRRIIQFDEIRCSSD
ncbi:MAG TPA: hypothetical protein PLU37_10040 [Chitinophagaceae bacterium]|nr:hypothetical protein [Flavobacteriaceae bacterium]MCB9054630.1 hypothetical protein [Chitinophagales bacterium]HPG11861.1 hypothetical protein [Chitinophagaceae bacterium]